MSGLLKLFIYLSAGEIIVRLMGLPVPGPMFGLALMLADFWANRQIDRDVEKIFDGVSNHLAVLFLPAGAGVIAHAALLSSGIAVIAIAVLAGTIVTILATATCFRLFLTGEENDQRKEIEQ